LNQGWTAQLRLQISDCGIFLIMCDVPSTAVSYRIYWMLSWCYLQTFFFSPLVTIPVAPMITGITKHFIFHPCWISILRFLYFILFLASFRITFLSYGVLRLSIRKFCFVFNYHVWPIG
jgi:hypothetical protein